MSLIIYTNQAGGLSIVIPTGELPIDEVAAKDVPAGADYAIVEDDAVPPDRTFRAAWVLHNGTVEHDLYKCKEIAHKMRRAMRAAEFAPHDDIIAKQIPGIDPSAAEAARQEIRLKYAAMQVAIDSATSPEEIKAALNA